MKKLLCIAAVAFTALVSANAQTYEIVPLLSFANRPTALATGWLVDEGDTTNYTALNKTVNVKNAEAVVVAVGGALAGTGTGDVEIYFQKSADGTVWETLPSIALTNVSTSNTRAEYVHNVSVPGAQWLRLHSIKNADDAEDLTNIVVSVGIKSK